MAQKRTISNILIVLLCIGIVLFSRLVCGIAPADGSSMEPTIHDGNHLLINRIVKTYQREDIVIAVHDGKYVCKRIIAVGGDEVHIDETGLYLNGELVIDDPDVYLDKDIDVILEDDEVFLLGDNYPVSRDSRTYGSVKVKKLKGRVIKILW